MNINATLIAQAIMFALFVWFSMKFVWPPIMQALAVRQKQIADGLAAAHRGKRATEIVEESKTNAKTEGDRIIAGAKAEIDQEVNRAKEGLRQQVSELAVAGAEKILRKEIDAKAHADMLKTIANEL
jgi:F-type H+-transporting ATPase subunit b